MPNWINQFTSIMLLAAVSCISAMAQYTGMPGTGTTSGTYTAPKGGYGSGAGIGIGLGPAAGAGVGYWALHNRPSALGCVQRSEQGNTIFNEQDGKTYHVVP